ncbi:Spermatogenesis associated 6-like protein [Anthophora retusa]
MAGKGFCVKIRLELHAITCPGVWLCPNGEVALRITSLGSTLESHRVSPIFPLLFHNEFNFKKTFTRLAALTELQRNLEQECLYAELIQWLKPSCNRAILLATFETSLADVLYPPVTHCERLLAGVDVDLLMDPSKYFPGIIAPKIEISTKTVIEEVTTVYDARNYPDRTSYCVVNPKTIDSKRKSSCVHRKRPAKGIIRQRSVCHSRARAKATACSPPRYRCEPCDIVEYSCRNEPRRINECYHPMKQKVKSLNEVDARPSVCGNLHIFDSCPVCLKYKCYFACECGDIAAAKSNQNLTDFYDYEHRWCYNSRTPNDNFALYEPISTGPQPRIRYLSESKDRGRYEERSRKVTGE